MLSSFIISAESTMDINYKFFTERKIPIIFYKYAIDGVEFEDNMGRDDEELNKFYTFIENGKLPTTSQINEYAYLEYFESLLKENKKILHIAFGSGMTPSVNNAVKASKTINEELGEERIIVVDSTCSSSGYGMFVLMAYEFAESGRTLEETRKFVEDNKYNVHHQFFSTDMKFFRRSGRVSGATATIATVLGICPIMHLNQQGKIVAYDKARSKKRAILKTLDEMKEHAQDGENYRGKCIINHSKCLDDALDLKNEVEKTFKNLKDKVEIFDIGNIVASHCGPGTVAIYFMGDKRV